MPRVPVTNRASTHRRRALDVGPVVTEIDAPPPLVYQMLAAIGQGPRRPGEGATVIERDGQSLVCDFETRVAMPLGWRTTVRTREAVRLVPPDRIEYRHLDGPVRGLAESIVVEALPGPGSRLVYRGRYPPPSRLHGLAFPRLVRPAVERAVRDHFADLRSRAEARAARSRVFAAPADQGRHGPDAS